MAKCRYCAKILKEKGVEEMIRRGYKPSPYRIKSRTNYSFGRVKTKTLVIRKKSEPAKIIEIKKVKAKGITTFLYCKNCGGTNFEN